MTLTSDKNYTDFPLRGIYSIMQTIMDRRRKLNLQDAQMRSDTSNFDFNKRMILQFK